MSKVLVIDDDYAFAEAIADMLADDGHTTLHAHDGNQAFEIMWEANPPFDVVACDWDLGMFDKRNGGEIVEFLRYEWGSPRYIIFSGLKREVPEGVEFASKGDFLGLAEMLA